VPLSTAAASQFKRKNFFLMEGRDWTKSIDQLHRAYSTKNDEENLDLKGTVIILYQNIFLQFDSI
jgi:hypothetical protein